MDKQLGGGKLPDLVKVPGILTMSKCGTLARLAALRALQGFDPRHAWRDAALEVFPTNKASRDKGCPRCTFLGLAEEGLIKGVPPGAYTTSKYNKEYAVAGVKALRGQPRLSGRPDLLWKQVTSGQIKQHNEQMDVVIALWDSGHIQVGAGEHGG